MSYTLYRPETVEEAVSLQVTTGGTYLAGGTVLLVNYHRRKDIGAHLISLDRINELRGISIQNDTLRIGALTTMDEIEASSSVKGYAYALWQSACEVGAPQIRNRATLGGNIAAASPSSDCTVPLLAMNAALQVSGADGIRSIPIREFFLGRMQHVLKRDELIVSIEIPVNDNAASVFKKVGKRNALAVSCINMAVVRCGKDISVSVGAAAPKPVFCAETSKILSESAENIEKACEIIQTEISPIDDRWATASYRRTVCRNLLIALLKETEEQK